EPDPAVGREKLPQEAERLQRAPDATNYERANAAYVVKDYPKAERESLQAAEEAKQTPDKPNEIVEALMLAALSAQKRIEYENAMTHFRDAEKLTDRALNPEQWANVQYAIAD